jgi:hypothetical protein
VDNDVKTVESKLLCQCYDTIKDVSRTTRSSSFFIEHGSINIFGTSTGNMLSSVCRQYNSNTMFDGTISRYLFVTSSAQKSSNGITIEILSVQPNTVHILIVARLLAQYKPIFVFGEHQSQNDLPTLGEFLCCPRVIQSLDKQPL